MLGATILAEAATALGRHVVQAQNYGPAARGGASMAEVIISDEEIDYPEVVAPRASLCLSQEAWDTYAAATAADGLVVYDSGLISPQSELPALRLLGIRFTELATQRLGKAVVANIVALGALVALTELLPADAVQEAVVQRVPPRFRDLNVEAFRLGMDVASATEGAVR